MSGDRFPSALIDDYTSVIRKKDPESLVSTVIRTRAVEGRRLLAHRIAEPPVDLDALTMAAGDPQAETALFERHQIDIGHLARLARALVCAPEDSSDLDHGWNLYGMASRHGRPEELSSRDQGAHAEFALLRGDFDETRRLLERYDLIDEPVRRAIEMDLCNPWSGAVEGDEARWKVLLAEVVPDPLPDLAPDAAETLFDSLHVKNPPAPVPAPELVSVIVTNFQRGLPLIASVQSVLEQTWQYLEVIVVDDASGPAYDEVLDKAAALDERVRVIRLAENGGTYRARNAGLAEARGDFVAVQDSDDWWHPRHLELHLRPFANDPELVGTISRSLMLTEDLGATRLRRAPMLPCASSLLFRREAVIERIGYWDDVRKAADNEFLGRIKAAFGKRSVHHMPEVLTLVRTGTESLSSSDFGSGWRHPARLAYRSGYQLWHRRIGKGEADPRVGFGQRAPVFQPYRFRIASSRQRYDVVYAGDWSSYGGPQKSMINEIHAARRAGLRVGIMNFTPFRFVRSVDRDLNPHIQQLANDGVVDHVTATDDAEVRLLVLRYPPILQFPPGGPCALQVDRLVILANQAPSERDGSDRRYLPEACEQHARQLFGVWPEWVPQGPQVRHAIEPLLTERSVLHPFDIPGIIDTDRWCMPRTHFRAPVAVIGRHSRDNVMKWPQDPVELLQAYPASPDIDVRIMGGAETPTEVLQRRRLPRNWVVYDYDEVGIREFLHQIDFYVYFAHPQLVEAFGRSILEAMAAGCVTVLPPHFEEVFGDGAVYCEPREVADLVTGLRSHPDEYFAMSARAQDHVRRHFSYASYLDRLELLGIRP
ncbi:glycosyltransferase [Glycomyces sp. TRM65418]|uniref:glycosyltransferase n=1 Tax=Glycomyces sp. TRM65418 TaxID=2867006 RepID=UPI001CE55A89|nr:glycosyltransferase [Glycomyces sp. TRM65418]MCC3762506.1 glycosyltransferase [Glycomyces sp. TRM65418]QZD56549.1 glycosyltransferase [Glycomyces sp. TRM65418]